MKSIILSLLLVLQVCTLFAQSENTETEIRSLEQMEVQAILKKDTVTLLKLWDKDYVVNSPNNVIVFPGKTTLDRPVLKNSRTSFTREIEQVIVRDNTVFSMGNETVVEQANTGQTIKRRYTNIWMKKNGAWKLVARHANIICQGK